MERKKLTADEVKAALENVRGWKAENDRLRKRFGFADFSASLAFVNKIGEAADALDHHPDIKLGWGYAEVEITTHDRAGITGKDFELAAKIDDLGKGS